MKTSVSIDELEVGGGFVYIQPYLVKDNYIPVNDLATGAVYFSYGSPEIRGARWFKDADAKQEINSDTIISFGSTVYLMICTKDLYGQIIDIQFKDDDSILGNNEEDNTDDDLGIYQSSEKRDSYNLYGNLPDSITKDTTVKRMVKTLSLSKKLANAITGELNKEDKNKDDGLITKVNAFQGAMFPVYIDKFWSTEANDFLEGSEIEIFPTILKKSIKNDKVLKNATLKVSKNGTLINPDNNQFNLPVLMGEIEGDYTNFLPCKYDKVIGNYQKGEEKIKINIFPLKDNSKPTQLIFPIVAGVKQARVDFNISLDGVKTDHCNDEGGENDHTGKVINISKIEKLIEQGKGKRSEKWRLIDYKGKGSGAVKDEQANDENDNASPDESVFTNKFKFKNGGSGLKSQQSFKILEEYNRFILDPPTDEELKLQVGYDFTWSKTKSALEGLAATLWPNNDAIAQKYPISLNTCAHSLPLDIMVYPDTKWTIQLAYNYDSKEFEELREAYHDKWALKEIESDEKLKKLKKREEGIPDKKYVTSKREKEKIKKEAKNVRKAKNKEINKNLKAKKNKSKISQARHMMGELKNTDLIDCNLALICEFDRPYQALELSSEFDEGLAFLKKIIKLKELINNIIDGKQENTIKNSPQEEKLSKKNKKRQEKLQEKLKEKESRSNWSFEFIPPSVALSLSWYAEVPKDLNTPVIGTMIEGAIDLDPLFGFEIKYDAYQLLYKIKHPVVLAVVATLDILDEALGKNFDINLDIIVTSEISGSLKGTINTAEGSNYVDRLMKDEDDSPCKFGGKVEIKLIGEIKANGTVTFFGFIKRTIYAGLEAVATTGISVECVTKADSKSIYVEPEIKFEGFILTAKFDAGIVDPPKDDTELTEADGLHYTADGRIVVLDPYEWETGWKLPIISLN